MKNAAWNLVTQSKGIHWKLQMLLFLKICICVCMFISIPNVQIISFESACISEKTTLTLKD